MNIEFVSYDGAFPNLCSGTLTLKIDKIPYVFGRDERYSTFWSSGGRAGVGFGGDEYLERGAWEFYIWDRAKFPEFLVGHESELMEVFNANIPYGCCGGCI